MNQSRSVSTSVSTGWVDGILLYVRSFDPNLRLIMLVGLLEAMSVNFYSSVLMPYYRVLGLNSRQVGSLNSALNVAAMLAGILGGMLADTFGRKKLYIAGQLVRTAAVILLLFTGNFAALFVVSLLRGISSIEFPSRSALLGTYTRQENRATVLGIFQTLLQLGALLAPLAAGPLAQSMGVRVPFGVGLVLSCSAVGLSLAVSERPRVREAPEPSTDDINPGATAARARLMQELSQLFSASGASRVLLLLLASLANGTANGATQVILPFTVMDRFSAEYKTMSSLQAFFALGTVLVLLAGGRLADLKGRRTVVITFGTLFPVLMSGVFFVQALWQLYLLGVLITMAGNISTPAIGAAYLEAVDEKHRGTFAGLDLGLNSLGMAIGSYLGGISYAWNPSLSWAWVIALFCCQLLVFHRVLPRR